MSVPFPGVSLELNAVSQHVGPWSHHTLECRWHNTKPVHPSSSLKHATLKAGGKRLMAYRRKRSNESCQQPAFVCQRDLPKARDGILHL